MSRKTAYESGARKLEPRTGPDPSDDFSQDAAANGRPEAREDMAGTTDQKPRWEGPPENRPRGYLPAKDDPSRDRDAAGENLRDPDKSRLSDAGTTREND